MAMRGPTVSHLQEPRKSQETNIPPMEPGSEAWGGCPPPGWSWPAIRSQNRPTSVHSRTTVKAGTGIPEQSILPSEKLGVCFQKAPGQERAMVLVSGNEEERQKETQGGMHGGDTRTKPRSRAGARGLRQAGVEERLTSAV